MWFLCHNNAFLLLPEIRYTHPSASIPYSFIFKSMPYFAINQRTDDSNSMGPMCFASTKLFSEISCILLPLALVFHCQIKKFTTSRSNLAPCSSNSVRQVLVLKAQRIITILQCSYLIQYRFHWVDHCSIELIIQW